MSKFQNLKNGDVLSETQFYKVVKKSGDQVQLKTDLGEDIIVSKEYVDTCLDAADQFTEEKKITKTEAAELFLQNRYIAMKANFNKQVKEADVVKEIMSAYENSTPKTMGEAVKKALKRGLEGEERTIVGRHNGTKDEFGRVHFIDMNIDKVDGKDYDLRQRLVDPRTLNWFIVKNTRYVVK